MHLCCEDSSLRLARLDFLMCTLQLCFKKLVIYRQRVTLFAFDELLAAQRLIVLTWVRDVLRYSTGYIGPG
ncbi:hypothetical protein BDV11DRAFT_179548 [Aspergillus similis]